MSNQPSNSINTLTNDIANQMNTCAKNYDNSYFLNYFLSPA